MDNEFIQLQSYSQPELIEVNTENKHIPRRITIIYELTTPKNEDFSEDSTKEQSEDLSR